LLQPAHPVGEPRPQFGVTKHVVAQECHLAEAMLELIRQPGEVWEIVWAAESLPCLGQGQTRGDGVCQFLGAKCVREPPDPELG
jgi:hypothetical protein